MPTQRNTYKQKLLDLLNALPVATEQGRVKWILAEGHRMLDDAFVAKINDCEVSITQHSLSIRRNGVLLESLMDGAYSVHVDRVYKAARHQAMEADRVIDEMLNYLNIAES